MRIIKFRIWDEMQHKFLFQGIGLTLNDINDKNTIIPGSEIIYSQFTGLLDESNKEIYEGDIVSINGLIGKWIIRYEKWGQFGMNGTNHEEGFCMDDHLGNTKIIGNIFENPDLLK